jgi:cysteine desulfurase/selenocysteine lyase
MNTGYELSSAVPMPFGAGDTMSMLKRLASSMAGSYFPEFAEKPRGSLPCASAGFHGSEFTSLPGPTVFPVQTALDPHTIRGDFPILQERINGRRLIWFDNAATTQKPRCVIERLRYFYEHENSNVHRTAHALAARATEAYELAREKAASFLHAGSAGEIVFVRGTTEAINLVAQSYGMETLSEGDEVVVSLLEHHANIIPWQLVCRATGAVLRTIPVDDNGQILLDEYHKILNKKTKIVSFTHVSNALGTITPAAEMIRLAHRCGAKVLVDGAQAAAHMKVDVQALGCDFYAFSGHKLFGPTGIGVLYGKASLLEGMRPYQGGGNMISDVTFERTTYKSPPHRFEAGTGSIADAVALGSAIDYVTRIGPDAIFSYEGALLRYASSAVRQVPGLALIGSAGQKAAILSFILKEYDCEEVGKKLSEAGIAVRAGHHCSQPILRRYGLEGTVRASFAFYNTPGEVDAFVDALCKIVSHG